MCRPNLPNVMSSGWHLHQSLKRNGANAFTSDKEDLSETGKQYLAGLLAHARGALRLSTPTINGYKRYRPYSLAPDRVIWGKENRGAMLRVIGRPGDPARGSRTASASRRPIPTCISPRSSIRASTDCSASSRRRPRPTRPTRRRPNSCRARSPTRSPPAAGQVLCDGLGEGFVDYYCRMKEAEIARFQLEVSEWEQREYFDLF